MANLERLAHWEPFAPNLGNNLELAPEQQFGLEIACGVTKLEVMGFVEALGRAAELGNDSAMCTALASAWGPFVRVAPGQHSINGVTIATLADYLGVVSEQPGLYSLLELHREMRRLNSVTGTRALFSGPPAGGATSTVRPSVAPAESQTGGR